MDAVNYYAPRYEERDRLSRGIGPEPTQAQGMDPGLRKWANETIRERLEAVEKDLPGLLEEIEKYLESEGVEAEKVRKRTQSPAVFGSAAKLDTSRIKSPRGELARSPHP